VCLRNKIRVSLFADGGTRTRETFGEADMMYGGRICVFVAALAVSSCAAEKYADSDEVERSARMSSEPAPEQVGEANEALTRYEICYKIVYVASLVACSKTHTPADQCRLLAEGVARTACTPLLTEPGDYPMPEPGIA
jgi:hypothetical protein